MLNEKTDEELMVAYQLGDERAFRELYKRHSPRIFGFIRRKTRSEAMAQDVFQSTFLKLHRSRARYNSSLPFVPWLFTICRSELIDALRKVQISKEESVAIVPETPSSGVARDAVDLSPLNASQRLAVDLRYTEDSSFEQIAAALETSPSNARQIVSRAVRVLRSFYGKK